jgi:hypothetical protein
MTKVAYGKSKKFYETHCGICDKIFNLTEDRYKGHCIFKNDEELHFLACERCAKSAEFQEAVKQTKEMGKPHDENPTDLQPESQEITPDRPSESKPVDKGHGRKRVDKKPVEKRSS